MSCSDKDERCSPYQEIFCLSVALAGELNVRPKMDWLEGSPAMWFYIAVGHFSKEFNYKK